MSRLSLLDFALDDVSTLNEIGVSDVGKLLGLSNRSLIHHLNDVLIELMFFLINIRFLPELHFS